MEKKHIIGCFYDCDQTLIPGYMQQPLFEHYGIDEKAFWQESYELKERAAQEGTNVDFEHCYLNLILDYVAEGKFPGLSNTKLWELGKGIKVFPGLPDFFLRTRKLIEDSYENITLEHYIITTGLKQMVMGSPLNGDGALTDVFASEFVERNGLVARIGRAIGHMKKTEFLHIVNKGANVDHSIDVNQRISRQARRIPFEQMIYVGDGFTDVPCFALIGDRGGVPLAVYDLDDEQALPQAARLGEQGRVHSISAADYRKGSAFSQRFEGSLFKIAKNIESIESVGGIVNTSK